MKCYNNFGPKYISSRRRAERPIRIYANKVRMTRWVDSIKCICESSRHLLRSCISILSQSFDQSVRITIIWGKPDKVASKSLNVCIENHRNRRTIFEVTDFFVFLFLFDSRERISVSTQEHWFHLFELLLKFSDIFPSPTAAKHSFAFLCRQSKLSIS